MVDVMGRTPEEFEEMLNAQIAEAERKAAAMDEFVTTLKSARVTGFDSRREVEVEISQEGTTRPSKAVPRTSRKPSWRPTPTPVRT